MENGVLCDLRILIVICDHVIGFLIFFLDFWNVFLDFLIFFLDFWI